jgi:uncharacterized membrane protein YfcA
MDHSLWTWALGLVAGVFVGLTKTGVPGLGILIVPLMATLFPAKQSVGALLLMLIVGDVFAVTYYRRYTQWKRLWGLFPAVAVGIAAGTFTLSKIDSATLKPMLGWLVLCMLGLEIARQRFEWTDVPHKWWFVVGTGFLAGFTTTVGNLAGPIMGIYLISKGMPKHQFMGTAAVFFCIVNLCKVPLFARLGMITGETIRFDVFAIPFIVAGALAGKWLLPRIPQKVFNATVLILAAVAALRLILS